MVKSQRDPLQALLVSRAGIYVKKAEDLINSLGSAHWEQWQLIFDTLDSIRGDSELKHLLKEIVNVSLSIFDKEEKIFVLSTALKTAIRKGIYLQPKELLAYTEHLMNFIFDNLYSIESASALAKIWYIAYVMGEQDILDEVSKLLKTLEGNRKVKSVWFADYYSELGSLLASEDLDLSERYFREAVSYASNCEGYEKFVSLCRIGVRYKFVTHSDDMDEAIYNIVEEVIDEIDLESIEGLRHFLDLSIYLHKINSELTESVLKRVYIKILSINEEKEKIMLSQSLVKSLDFLGLDELKSHFLNILARNIDFLDNNGIYNIFVASLISRYADIPIGFRYDFIDAIIKDIDENFDQYSRDDNIDVTSIILENLISVDHETVVSRITELIKGKLEKSEKGKDLLRIINFVKSLKKVAPKVADEISVMISDRIIGDFSILPNLDFRFMKNLAETSEGAYNRLLNTILKQIDQFKKDEKYKLLAFIIPPVYIYNKVKFYALLDELDEDLKGLPASRSIKYRRMIAENLAMVNKDISKEWYRKTIRDCEILKLKRKNKALKEIAKTIKSIEEVLEDKLWAKHLKAYYLSLDIFLEL